MSIDIVGLGVGNLDYITGIAKKKLIASDIIIGGERQLKDISPLLTFQELYTLKKLAHMKDYVDKNIEKKICFIVSGDTGFYSLVSYLRRFYEKEIENIIPGISSFQYLFSKIGETWEYYNLYSMHGRKLDFISKLDKSKKGIVLLTDKNNTPKHIGEILYEKEYFNIEMIIGENLSYDNEKIERFKINNLKEYIRDYEMNVLILKKE
ncbi:precorrin-6y C5,15-methyltransferase (decarboxylating) subunit CbiE [Fusobacterium sp. IOR10]|jgi:cobalt-precorrin-7 (C5)-methyltransferase|uniref:precorrin-6y C5,15-methyltransferase (decarboxylating) subunit CbiE n=1 Tax=Fusobacterium sp. IOR10 TaxID=2665157 RepID=UPI0013CF9820|nr:precorrin-6y C5,15-methyltransferase (decarboxylating) subunit CbiE [Fusobacterium sp. IOR10]